VLDQSIDAHRNKVADDELRVEHRPI